MELGEVQAELTNGLDDHGAQEGGAVGVEEGIQRPPAAVVVEEPYLLGSEVEQVGGEGDHPPLGPVDRSAVEDEVPQEHAKDLAEGQGGFGGGEGASEVSREVEAPEEVVEDGEGPQPLGVDPHPLGHGGTKGRRAIRIVMYLHHNG